MLASITPLGEWGRQARWGITVAAFGVGATGAGAAAGALTGGAGAIVLPGSVGANARLGALALAALGALALDRRADGVPGPRRQVSERWLDEYRGWVYGLGYGGQLGLGIATVVSSAATYLALVAAFLSSSPIRGALVVGCYGAVRGLTPLAAARVRSPSQLVALHERLTRWHSPTIRGCVALLVAILALAAVGSVG